MTHYLPGTSIPAGAIALLIRRREELRQQALRQQELMVHLNTRDNDESHGSIAAISLLLLL